MRGAGTLGAALVAALALAACAIDLGAEDADADVLTIGVLRSVPDPDHHVFLQELRNQGWRDGENIRVLPTDGELVLPDVDEAREVLRGWVDEGIDLVIAYSTPHAQLVRDEAPGVPTLVHLNDPVASGLVEDPQRPEGALTGVSYHTPSDRTLHLARQVIGDLRRIGYVHPADDPAVPSHRRSVLDAAEELDIEVVEASFARSEDVPDAIAALPDADVDAVLLATANATIQAIGVLEEELGRHRLPTIANTDFATFAVLVLTPDRSAVRRQLARQAARLLAGADVSAVPVEDPRRFRVIINRTVAAELDLPDLDPTLLRQADLVR